MIMLRPNLSIGKDEKMKYIKLFLASSAVEFEQERNELGSYIRMLNDIYAKRGIYFELTIWDDLPEAVERERAQEECNQAIRDSQYFYVLFGRDAGEDTIQEFNVALEQFRKSGAPRIYTYFRQLPAGQSASQSVKDFMERLDQEIGHYYSTFSHLDAVKLNMLLELTRNSDLNSNLKFEDGEAKLDGKPVLALGNVPIYSKNEELQKQMAEKRRLDEEFADLSVAALKAPEDEELSSRLREVSKQRNQLSDQIHQMEMSILDLCSSVSKMNDSGRPLTWREKKADRLLDAGDYEGAWAILDDIQRKRELEHAEEVKKNGVDQIRGYISETRKKILILKARGITTQTIPELEAYYEETVQLAEKHRIELDVLYDYANFLYDLRRYPKGIAVAERLNKYYGLKQASEDDQAALKNLLGLFYSNTNRFMEAEKCYQEALEIYRKLAKENPEAYEEKVADICNNLGVLYKYTNRTKEAEECCQETLEIRRRLAKENPEADEGKVAIACNNLGILYSNTNQIKEAEGYYQEALRICRRLAKENPEAYEGNVAMTCNNLGVFYDKTNRRKEAEEYYQEALEIYRKLAKENPETYERNVAMTGNNLGNLYCKTNRTKEAEEYYQETLEIRCRLAKENPEAHEGDFAMTCNNLGILYCKTNRTKEAEEYYQEALEIRCRLAKENPETYAGDVAMTYSNLGNLYSDINRTKEAERYYQEALKISRGLAKENPESYEGDVAGICNNLGNLYSDINRNKEAEEYYQEALKFRRRLAKKNPEVYAGDVATTCYDLGVFYSDINRKREAEEYYQEALEIYRKLAKENPEAYEGKVATTCNNLGRVYGDTDRMKEAEELYQEALEIRRRLAKKTPEVYEEKVADTSTILAFLYFDEGQKEKSKLYFENALAIYEKYPSCADKAQMIRDILSKYF